MDLPPAVRQLTAAALAVLAILCLLHVALGLAGGVEAVRLDREQNLPTWVASMLFAAAGFACGLSVWLGRPKRSIWAVVGALMLAMSIDEFAQTHERVGGALEVGLAETVLQPVVGVAVLLFLLSVARSLGRTVGLLLLGAAAALAVGQGAATLASLVEAQGLAAALVVIVEEVSEMLVATSVLAAAGVHVGSLARTGGRDCPDGVEGR